MLPKVTHHYQTWNSEDLALCQTRTNIFKYSFLPIQLWNRINLVLLLKLNGSSVSNHLLKIIQPVSNPVHNIQNYISSKLLTRLTLVLSHLIEHRFDHSFQNCISPLCNCSLEVESTAHFFLHCHYYHNISPKHWNSLEVKIQTYLSSLKNN